MQTLVAAGQFRNKRGKGSDANIPGAVDLSVPQIIECGGTKDSFLKTSLLVIRLILQC